MLAQTNTTVAKEEKITGDGFNLHKEIFEKYETWGYNKQECTWRGGESLEYIGWNPPNFHMYNSTDVILSWKLPLVKGN